MSYLFHEATNALEYGNHIRCFLIDFSKAFDTVPHHQLLGKLVSYNCPQILINWIANYLTDRTQSVTCSSGCSLPLRNTRSIIQGSGFGPAGFIAYNADLRPLNNENIFCKFADDLTILVRHDDTASAELAHIQQWSVENKVKINLDKTKEIVIHKSRLKHFNVPDPICNIRQVDSVKLLGVIFNNHLSFTGHIDYICSAANQRFHPIKQLQHQGLSKAGSEIVFNALVLSKVLYACQSFYGH